MLVYHSQSIELRQLAPSEMPIFGQMLASHNLAIDDLSQAHQWFWCYHEGERVGTLGLEQYGKIGLLRSLSVLPTKRSQNIGAMVVDALLRFVPAFGLAELYLLTTTAEAFFAKQGFQQIKRSAVPTVIQQTQQFSSLCPTEAIVMHRSV